KVRCPGFVHLVVVGEEQQFHRIGGFHRRDDLVAVLELLLAGHTQALGRDLLEIAVTGIEQRDGIIRISSPSSSSSVSGISYRISHLRGLPYFLATSASSFMMILLIRAGRLRMSSRSAMASSNSEISSVRLR